MTGNTASCKTDPLEEKETHEQGQGDPQSIDNTASCKTNPLEEKETHEQGRWDPQFDQELLEARSNRRTHSTWVEMKPHGGGNYPHRGGSEDHTEVVEKDHYRVGESLP